MYFFWLLVCFASIRPVESDDIQQNFKDYQHDFDRHYQPGEEERRFECFRHNVGRIAHLNRTEPDAVLGWTKLTDWCEDEIQSMLGFRSTSQNEFSSVEHTPIARFTSRPIDWRSTAVSPVADQGQCGSCWAFSALVAIEGAWAATHGKLYELSAEELVDCDSVLMPGNCTGGVATENQGCAGGVPQFALDWVIKNKGLNTEVDYPYVHNTIPTTLWCKWDLCKTSYAPITGVTRLPSNEASILSALQKSPLSAGIAVAPSLIDYKGGIIRNCPSFAPDHGVGIVGYGEDKNGKGYWIMKNSWGADWGENGFFRLEYGSDQCGITKWVVQATA